MPSHPSPPDWRQARQLLTLARAHDAEICAFSVSLSRDEVDKLRRTLDLLIELGALALYRLDTPVESCPDWPGVFALLRAHIGAVPVDAADAAAAYPATTTPKPQTLIPLWPFEQDGDGSGTLSACGLCLGASMVFEALPVEDHDLTKPLPAAVSRFAAWQEAVGRCTLLGTVAVPGHEGAYSLFASTRAG